MADDHHARMPENEKISVVIVDDHPLFRQGLRQAVEADARFNVIGEEADGTAAAETIAKLKPDVAVLDINLPGMTGLEVAARLQVSRSPARLVVLTMLKDEQAFNRALNAGVQGYVLKENASDEILNCIVAVARGEAYVSPSLTGFMLSRRRRANLLATRQPSLEDLTVAEKRILQRIAAGKTSKEIAAELFISPRTVETHRANISSKLSLSGANRLLQFAWENRDALNHLA